MDNPEQTLEPNSLVLAQGQHGAWFPARITQLHSQAVMVTLNSELEQHFEWVPLGCGRCAHCSTPRRARPVCTHMRR
tara:strand:+ start:941 stop:1171 length:231 start_codon:yes stop_codon:yes gene_type:complete